ncbi:MerC domain-containing protein [Roseivirga sp. BDSF3-8]|uniref:MerC domain-containing protein n=1 Tax=Roseivirga sp. BDSF3-8 TaxID=3241598 RepID=UPI0035321880
MRLNCKRYMQRKGRSDIMGIISSGLCIMHCLAFPVFLAATGNSAAWLEHSFHGLDYLFVILALIAIYFSTRNLDRQWLQYAMWSCGLLFSVMVVLHTYGAAFRVVGLFASLLLVVFHLINVFCYRRNKACFR